MMQIITTILLINLLVQCHVDAEDANNNVRSAKTVLLKSRVYSPAHDALLEIEDVARQSSTEAYLNGKKEGPMYINHPYQKYAHRMLENHGLESLSKRMLTSNGGRRLEEEESPWKNLRVKADVSALESRRDGSAEMDGKIDFIRDIILPRTLSYWSQALMVIPVEGNLKISTSELANRQYCGDSEFAEVPPSHVTDGIPNTDLILYISASDSSRFCPSGGETLAVAVACNFDVFDRPIAGAVNFCLDKIDINRVDDDATIQDNLDVAIHETGHIVAMSGNSYKYFYDPLTGEPRTPRPLSTSTVTCVDGTQRVTTIPAENTMRFFVASNGQRYASIVTEKVSSVARNQFNCQSLEGGQLENQPTGSSCHGDHWDERQYYPENLSGGKCVSYICISRAYVPIFIFSSNITTLSYVV